MSILQFSKDDITRGEFSPHKDEIEIKQNETSYEDEQTSIEAGTPVINSSQSPQDLTNVIPNSQQNLEKVIALVKSYGRPETAVDVAINDDKDDEEDKGDAYDHENDKDHDDDKDHKDQKVETNIDMTSIMVTVKKLSREGNERKKITFLDFAGQSIYYAFHQIYLSCATFSILVVDMTKNPEDQCEATNVSDGDFCCSQFDSWTYKGSKI